MNNQTLLLAFLCFGTVSIASGWFCTCCCIFCICIGSVMDPQQMLTGETFSPRAVVTKARAVGKLGGQSNLERIPPEALLLICDTNKDKALSRDEFELCLQETDETRRAFNQLDTDEDDTLYLADLKKYELSLAGSGDCYKDMIARCAAQFVMYERVRSVTKSALCGGLQMYADCVQRAASTCDDPRVSSLSNAFDWIEINMKKSCTSDGNERSLSPDQRAALQCSANLVRALHSSEPPCAAMATFDDCLQNKASAGERDLLFRDVAQLAGCNRK